MGVPPPLVATLPRNDISQEYVRTRAVQPSTIPSIGWSPKPHENLTVTEEEEWVQNAKR